MPTRPGSLALADSDETFMTKRYPLSGVFAAVPTPIHANGEPDSERFLIHARWALGQGLDGLNVLGTTGEANSLSAGQRRKVMEATAADLDPTTFMVGTGTPDLATTIELTDFAHDLGFAAALILPPYYYKGISDDGLLAWFDRVVQATRTKPIPIYLYNFPQMTGVPFSPELVRRLVEALPDRIQGIKDSSGDLTYAATLAKIKGLAVFPSDESSLARAAADGFMGCVSATANQTANLASRLWKDQGNEALLDRVKNLRQAIASNPLIAAVKYLVGRTHQDQEFERILPPHLPLSSDQKQALSSLDLA